MSTRHNVRRRYGILSLGLSLLQQCMVILDEGILGFRGFGGAMILTHCFLCLIASVLDVFSYVWDRSDRKGDVFDFFSAKCYAMDCFGTYFTLVQICDNVRVQSATQWTASVHTLHMSKPVITIIVNSVYYNENQ